jgi:hypothetical protein
MISGGIGNHAARRQLRHGLPKHDNLAEYEIAQTSGLAELRQQVSIFGADNSLAGAPT